VVFRASNSLAQATCPLFDAESVLERAVGAIIFTNEQDKQKLEPASGHALRKVSVAHLG
jgi:hypothetical protein